MLKLKLKIKKENLKTYILTALIISSVILTGKIWFDEKLWPEGYNFFSVITDNFFASKRNFVSSLTKETISFPKTLVVTNLETRSVYTADSSSFEAMAPDVKELLRLALESNQSEIITEQDWASSLKSRSIHVMYPVAYDSKLFMNILGSYQTTENSIPVREFIISPPASGVSAADIYIRNYDTNQIFKSTVTWDYQRLSDMIDAYALDSIGDFAYSSELNFDKPASDTGAQQKVIIDSHVLIQLNKQLNHKVEETNPIYDYDFNNDAVNGLLKQFDYNISGARKYIERDNSMFFVENYSTLRLHPEGLVEYKAVDEAKGIDLGSGNDFYQGLMGCVDFVNRTWGAVVPSKALNINITSDVIDTKSNAFRLTMDYFADGAQISINLPASNSHTSMNHAVEIEVVGGKIISYRQVFAHFDTADISTDGLSAIDALDKLLAGENSNGLIVRDLYPVYIADEPPYLTSAWAARTSDNKTVIIH